MFHETTRTLIILESRMKIIAKHILGDRPVIDLDGAYIIEFGEGYEASRVSRRPILFWVAILCRPGADRLIPLTQRVHRLRCRRSRARTQ
jgi:hypothetical protein